MNDLSGKTAIVTGAAQGNGAAIARALAAAGMRAALADIDADGLSATGAAIREAGGDVFAAPLDVTDAAACRDFADKARAALGPAFLLVNNAGVIARDPIDADSYAENLRRLLAVNVEGVQNMTRAALPQLEATGGSIVNLGSIMSLAGGPNASAYAASKGAVAQLTRALANELAPRGVRVNALLPGVIATPMTEPTRANPDAIGRFLAHTPMGRVGQPEELAGPVIFLASAAASYVTGALLPVDGGYLTA